MEQDDKAHLAFSRKTNRIPQDGDVSAALHKDTRAIGCIRKGSWKFWEKIVRQEAQAGFPACCELQGRICTDQTWRVAQAGELVLALVISSGCSQKFNCKLQFSLWSDQLDPCPFAILPSIENCKNTFTQTNAKIGQIWCANCVVCQPACRSREQLQLAVCNVNLEIM